MILARRRASTARLRPALCSEPIVGSLGLPLALVALMALWGLLEPSPAQAHTGPVGVAQTRLEDDGVTVTALLKLRAEVLLEALHPEQGPDGDISLLGSPQARERILDLLAATHTIKTSEAACERDAIEHFELSPQRRWFDVIMRYHCPPTGGDLTVRIETLLTESGHQIMAQFQRGQQVERRPMTRRSPTYTFARPDPLPGAPQAAEAPPEPPAPPMLDVGLVLSHAELALLLLLLLAAPGPGRLRLLAAALSAAAAGASVALAAVVPMTSLLGVVAIIAIAALALRHHLQAAPLTAPDLPWPVLAAIAAGLSLGADKPAVGSLLALSGLSLGAAALGLWLGQRPLDRHRRLLAWTALSALVFLAVGEAARLAPL